MIAATLGVALLVLPNAALAHGVGYRESDRKPLSLEFSYSTGETMCYLETQVFSPRDARFAYQTGRTDANGRFAFTPDAAGTWRVIVKDSEGHMAEANIDVTPEFLQGQTTGKLVTPKESEPHGMDLVIRSTLGVSLLLNVAVLVLFFRRRKRA